MMSRITLSLEEYAAEGGRVGTVAEQVTDHAHQGGGVQMQEMGTSASAV